MKRTMTRSDARRILQQAGIDPKTDYHALRFSEVEKVLAVAKLYGYRKSPSASGSKARLFLEMLQRSK